MDYREIAMFSIRAEHRRQAVKLFRVKSEGRGGNLSIRWQGGITNFIFDEILRKDKQRRGLHGDKARYRELV
jgi:hypothetical protein